MRKLGSAPPRNHRWRRTIAAVSTVAVAAAGLVVAAAPAAADELDDLYTIEEVIELMEAAAAEAAAAEDVYDAAADEYQEIAATDATPDWYRLATLDFSNGLTDAQGRQWQFAHGDYGALLEFVADPDNPLNTLARLTTGADWEGIRTPNGLLIAGDQYRVEGTVRRAAGTGAARFVQTTAESPTSGGSIHWGWVANSGSVGQTWMMLGSAAARVFTVDARFDHPVLTLNNHVTAAPGNVLYVDTIHLYHYGIEPGNGNGGHPGNIGGGIVGVDRFFDFEGGQVAPWIPTAGGTGNTAAPAANVPTLSVISPGASGSNYALAVTNRPSNTAGAMYDLSQQMPTGATVTFSAYVRFLDGEGYGEISMMRESDIWPQRRWYGMCDPYGRSGLANPACTAYPIFTVGNEWTRIDWTFRLLNYAEVYRPYFATPAGNTRPFAIDNVRFHAEDVLPFHPLPSLKETMGGIPLGIAVDARELRGTDGLLVLEHFNSLSMENHMKPEAWFGGFGGGGTWDFTRITGQGVREADGGIAWPNGFRINPQAVEAIDFAAEHGLGMWGHVLVWHSQIPAWFFQVDPWGQDGPVNTTLLVNAQGVPAAGLTRDQAREIMLGRLEDHIYNISRGVTSVWGLYGSPTNPFTSWEAVNEVVGTVNHDLAASTSSAAGGSPTLRQPNGDPWGPGTMQLRATNWARIIGGDFNHWAFYFANNFKNGLFHVNPTATAADPLMPGDPGRILLWNNDYNTERDVTKLNRMIVMTEHQVRHGIPVDGLGHQFHIQDLQSHVDGVLRALNMTRDMNNRLRADGYWTIVTAATELDMTLDNPSMGHDSSTYAGDLQARLYAAGWFWHDVMNVLRQWAADNPGYLEYVTIWGLHDGRSWRANRLPTLFCPNRLPKPAFWGAVGNPGADPTNDWPSLPLRTRALDVFGGAPVFADAAFGNIDWVATPAHSLGNAGTVVLRHLDGTTLAAFVSAAGAVDTLKFELAADVLITVTRAGVVTGGAQARVREVAGGWEAIVYIPYVPGTIDVTGLTAGAWVGNLSSDFLFQLALRDAFATTSIVGVEDAPALGLANAARDPLWDDAVWQTTDLHVAGTGTPTADSARANFATLWVEGGMYALDQAGTPVAVDTLIFRAEVIDDSIHVDGNQPWYRDSVDLLLDLGNAKQGAFRANDIQFTFAAMPTSWTRTGPATLGGAGDLSGVFPEPFTRGLQNLQAPQLQRLNQVHIQFTPTGYVVEAEIGLWYFNEHQTPDDALSGVGRVHGLDVRVNDVGPGGSGRVAHAWATSNNTHSSNPSHWGVAQQVGIVEPGLCVSYDLTGSDFEGWLPRTGPDPRHPRHGIIGPVLPRATDPVLCLIDSGAGGQALAVTERQAATGSAQLSLFGQILPFTSVTFNAEVRFIEPGTTGTVQLARNTATGNPPSMGVANLCDAVEVTDAWTTVECTFSMPSLQVIGDFYLNTNAGNTAAFAMRNVSFDYTPRDWDVPYLPRLVDFMDGMSLGVAIDWNETVGFDRRIVERHFDSISNENHMKPEAWFHVDLFGGGSGNPTVAFPAVPTAAQIPLLHLGWDFERITGPGEGTRADHGQRGITWDNGFRIHPQTIATMDLAAANGMGYFGHVLIWHGQAPVWLFQVDPFGHAWCSEPANDCSDPAVRAANVNRTLLVDAAGNPAPGFTRDTARAEMLRRMENHIYNISRAITTHWGLYGSPTNPFTSWEVINEVVGPVFHDLVASTAVNAAGVTQHQGSPTLRQPNGEPWGPGVVEMRNTHWTRIIGGDFTHWAFYFANNFKNGQFHVDPTATAANPLLPGPAGRAAGRILLWNNDYNTQLVGPKLDQLVDLSVHQVRNNMPIDGKAHQFHVGEGVPPHNLYRALNVTRDMNAMLASEGRWTLKTAITELDVGGFGLAVAPNVQERMDDQGWYFYNAFNYFRRWNAENPGYLVYITVWGLHDMRSWIGPPAGAGIPLLFSGSRDAKPAFWGAAGNPGADPGNDWPRLAPQSLRIPTFGGAPEFADADFGTAYWGSTQQHRIGDVGGMVFRHLDGDTLAIFATVEDDVDTIEIVLGGTTVVVGRRGAVTGVADARVQAVEGGGWEAIIYMPIGTGLDAFSIEIGGTSDGAPVTGIATCEDWRWSIALHGAFNTTTIQQAPRAPVLGLDNAARDPLWNTAQWETPNNRIFGTAAQSRAYADFATLWVQDSVTVIDPRDDSPVTGDTLFFRVEVEDPHIRLDGASAFWFRSSVDIVIDLGNNKGLAYRNYEDVQFNFAAAEKSWIRQDPADIDNTSGIADGVTGLWPNTVMVGDRARDNRVVERQVARLNQVHVQLTPTGYVVEAEIGLWHFNEHPSADNTLSRAGMFHGFDVRVTNVPIGANPGTRVAHTFSMTGDHASMRPYQWGVAHQVGLDVVCPLPDEPTFVDVPFGAPLYRYIEWMYCMGISRGYLMLDGTRQFRPANSVHRGALAAFFYRLAGTSVTGDFVTPTTARFVDVPLGAPFFREIEWMAYVGISTGYADGTFRPANNVHRGAVSAFMYRFAGEDVTGSFVTPTTATFADVPVGAPFFRQIEWMAYVGITTGYSMPDGTRQFRPGNNVHRGAIAAFMSRLANNL